ncbi:hypothetical protein QFZ58_000186 [Streptomyces sp. B1I3]|nr:hypothetical protein [Streptomyces sp. B1I3]
MYELDVLGRDGEACFFLRFPHQAGDRSFPLAVAGQEVPGARREGRVRVAQAEEDPAMLDLEVEVDTDDVEFGPGRGFAGQWTGAVRRAVRCGVLGRVAADQFPQSGTQAASVEHVSGAPLQQDAFAEMHRVGVTVPAAGVDLDGDRKAVDACCLLHGERRQIGGFQAWRLLGELPPQGRLEAGVVPRAAAALMNSSHVSDPLLSHKHSDRTQGRSIATQADAYLRNSR